MKKYAIVDIETTGLDPRESEITAIGVKWSDETDIVVLNRKDPFPTSEKQILEEFWNDIEDRWIDTLVGFNFDFDWTFLKLRSLKHNLPIRYFSKFEERKDLRRILDSMSRYTKGTGLGDYAEFFGFGEKDGDSSLLPEKFEQGKYEEIREHLIKDVELTEKIFQRLIDCNVIQLDV